MHSFREILWRIDHFERKGWQIIRAAAFLILLIQLLKIVSDVSISMNKNKKVLYNYSTEGIFEEPDQTIDVVAIGNSNVYCGISPLYWWKNYGITGFAWGEASQRMSETYEYLKMIYQHQKPGVVLIETDNVFRDKTLVENLDSIVKAKMAGLFPLITYHRKIDPHRLTNLLYDDHSLTKGYSLRKGIKKVHDNPLKRRRRKKTSEMKPINPISKKLLHKCIKYCRNQGSEVILITLPSYASWTYKKHNAIQKEADKAKVKYLDLNLQMKDQMNWDKDTSDRGTHLNMYGAEKTTHFLGNYLHENCKLTDHRKDDNYKKWNEDLHKFSIMTKNIKRKDKKQRN